MLDPQALAVGRNPSRPPADGELTLMLGIRSTGPAAGAHLRGRPDTTPVLIDSSTRPEPLDSPPSLRDRTRRRSRP